MSTFSALDIAGSGVSTDQTWIDTIGGNVANMNDTVNPSQPVYRPEFVVAAPRTESGADAPGVQVEAVTLGSAQGVLQYQPGNPAANPQGIVKSPDVSLGHEMVSLTMAQASYQANSDVMSHADRAYQSILSLKS